MQLSLKNNLGFSWYQNETVFLKGYFFDEKDNYYDKENAISFLSEITSKEDFLTIIHQINGCFTIIIKTENSCFIASDTTRIFPVFYTFQNKQLYVSDDISFLKETFNIHNFDKLAETELKSALHTYGKKTLLKDVFQIQSNEYLIIENDNITEHDFFFSYATEKTNTASYNEQKEQAILVFESAFKRLITSLNGRTIALPLSGGFDSRLIAVLLKKHNYTNVICYTYGKKNSFEIKNSKKTAKALGFKWHFIEYNDTLFNNLLSSSTFKKFVNYAGKYASMPNPQEYFAVQYFKKNNLIPDDSIFIPGYAGDILGGSLFLKIIPKRLQKKNIINIIIKHGFNLNKIEKERIKNELEVRLENTIYHNKLSVSIFEDIHIKERITKYIFNSANFYTFWGYEHRFPFWDKELLNFFKEIPETHKVGKLLFDDVLINHYFKPFKVSFEEELQPSKKTLILQKIKNKIRPFLPIFMKKRFLEKNSWINYKPLTAQFEADLKKNGLSIKKQLKSYNEVIVQWYVFFAKEKLK